MEPSAQFSSTSGENATQALQQEVESLRALLVGLLFIAILLSFSVNIYLRERSYTVSRDAAEAQKFVGDYNTIGAPSARNLWFELNQYARTHPDFNPIIAKYSPYITTSASRGAAQQR